MVKNNNETAIELNYDKSNTKYYLSPETNPPYPGELFCRAYTNNNADKVELKRFKRLPYYADLYRNFTKKEVSAVVNTIKKSRTIPYLGFVTNILSPKYEIDLKSPFWFIPFVVMADKVGCMLYFEQNGFYGNIRDKDNIECAFNSDNIDGVHYSTGLHPKDHINKDNVSTIKIDAITGGYLTINEFHGKDYGSQLLIVKTIWDLWKEVVDYNRNETSFILNYKGAPSKVGFSNWEELLEWAEIKQFIKADHVDDRQKQANNLVAKGMLCATIENWSDAEELFTEAIKLNPIYELAYKYRGISRSNSGNVNSAIDDFDKYIELKSDDSEAYRLRGRIKGQLSKHIGAIEDFSKAITFGKDDGEISTAHYMRGYARYLLEEDKKAILDFDEAIRLNSEYAYAYYSRGVCKLRLNQKGSALSDLQKAVMLGYEEAVELIKEVGENDKSALVADNDFCTTRGLTDNEVDRDNNNEALVVEKLQVTSGIKAESESEIKYLSKLREYLSDGNINETERHKLEAFEEAFGISSERAKLLEQTIKNELDLIDSQKEKTISQLTRKLSPEDIETAVIAALQSLGGVAAKNVVEQKVYEMLETWFLDPYYQEDSTPGIKRWKHQINWARNSAKDHGLIKSPGESGRGIWALTEKGMMTF